MTPPAPVEPDGLARDFTKYQALGNDYAVIDTLHRAAAPTPQQVRLICDRRRGLGADGLLHGPLPAPAGYRVRTYNPDGSECPQSVNGLRIFARYLYDAGHSTRREFTVHCAAGPAAVRVHPGDGTVSADLGAASPHSGDVGAAGPARTMVGERLTALGEDWRVTCVDVGTPHCVVPLPATRVTPDTARRLGAALRKHPVFPHGVNLVLLAVRDRARLRLEIFERAAGYALASGAGAAAAVFAAHTLGLTGPEVTVAMPGGEVRVATDGRRLSLTGPVCPVLHGKWAAPLADALATGARP